jgi:hypothetical protein
MSLLDRRLRASFKLAEDNAHLDDVESSVPSRQVLQDSYELLVRARDQDSIVGASATVKSPDLLVVGAEAAIKNSDFVVAAESVHAFFTQAPPKDQVRAVTLFRLAAPAATDDDSRSLRQFYCRALFIQALVEAEKANPNQAVETDVLNGSVAVKQLERAIYYILEALQIALHHRAAGP